MLKYLLVAFDLHQHLLRLLRSLPPMLARLQPLLGKLQPLLGRLPSLLRPALLPSLLPLLGLEFMSGGTPELRRP